MRIDYDPQFIKQLQRAPKKIQIAVRNRLEVFLLTPKNSLLRNHILKGNYAGCRSININGDWRALYQELDDGKTAYFFALGTHSQLYR